MQYSVFENDFALTDYPKSAGLEVPKYPKSAGMCNNSLTLRQIRILSVRSLEPLVCAFVFRNHIVILTLGFGGEAVYPVNLDMCRW